MAGSDFPSLLFDRGLQLLDLEPEYSCRSTVERAQDQTLRLSYAWDWIDDKFFESWFLHL